MVWLVCALKQRLMWPVCLLAFSVTQQSLGVSWALVATDGVVTCMHMWQVPLWASIAASGQSGSIHSWRRGEVLWRKMGHANLTRGSMVIAQQHTVCIGEGCA